MGGPLATLARATLVGMSLLCCGASFADSINLNAESCRDFLSANPAAKETVLAWLDGYYQEEDAPPIVDFDALKTNAAKLKAYCAAHGGERIGAAAESLFGNQ